MGLMSQILQSEPKKFQLPAKIENRIEKSTEKPIAEKTACEKCGCPDLWESIYADGVLRCDLCEPAPTPDIVGRRVGLAAETLELDERQGSTDDVPQGSDPADRFVNYVTADGQTGMALRGWNDPRSANYNQRLCMSVCIGAKRYKQLLDEWQDELREEIFVAKQQQKR